MADGVHCSDVLRVLRAHKVAVTLKEPQNSLYTMERGDFFEEAVLTGIVSKKYLFYLKRKCDIPISHFWNPDQAEQIT